METAASICRFLQTPIKEASAIISNYGCNLYSSIQLLKLYNSAIIFRTMNAVAEKLSHDL